MKDAVTDKAKATIALNLRQPIWRTCLAWDRWQRYRRLGYLFTGCLPELGLFLSTELGLDDELSLLLEVELSIHSSENSEKKNRDKNKSLLDCSVTTQILRKYFFCLP